MQSYQQEALEVTIGIGSVAFGTPVRVECDYKIGIERKIREKLSEKVQPSISSVSSHESKKYYRAVLR